MTIKTNLVFAIAATLASLTAGVNTAAAYSQAHCDSVYTELNQFGETETKSYGGSGGGYFAPQPVRSIAIRAGRLVDAIVINGVRYGGGGGSQTHTLVLKPCEYISEVTVRSQRLVDYIKITTNFGRSIEAGGSGGTASTYRGKITHIGGRRGRLLDQLILQGQPRTRTLTLQQHAALQKPVVTWTYEEGEWEHDELLGI